ncbi:hypothetical protein N0V93_006978 [Gnomoniopsis smithogilvyi]|uniref:Uncharacterized protein n=1 Tax=Gnomoniopsis smithogilvyi TaxID=1191159 RepID=A0A9W9CUY3_9PEZI|nr:hypothetical protein N0V93_006978 [Gnomoniopsis smithogilvyi]
MKPSTPRKSRRRNQPQPTNNAGSVNHLPVSDYESDAPHGQPSASAAATVIYQSTQAIQGVSDIDDMNLRVLRRYVPSIQSYLKPISTSTTVYKWDAKEDTYGDAIAKGPLFVCNQDPDMSSGQPVTRACIVVINRQAFDNCVIPLANPTFISQNEDQKRLIEVHTANPQGDIVVWGLYVDPEGLDATLAAIQDRSNAVRRTAQ